MIIFFLNIYILKMNKSFVENSNLRILYGVEIEIEETDCGHF